MYVFSLKKERERYRDPVRECLKALLALGWTIEHSEIEVPQNHRGSTRRQSKPQIVCKIFFVVTLNINVKITDIFVQLFFTIVCIIPNVFVFTSPCPSHFLC